MSSTLPLGHDPRLPPPGTLLRREFKGKSILVKVLPSQRKFLESASPVKGFSGPVGSGKTYALGYQALRSAAQNPNCTGLLGAPTYDMLEAATIPMLLDSTRATWDRSHLPQKQKTSSPFTPAGSRILLQSMDRPERLRGTNLAWIGIDELLELPLAWILMWLMGAGYAFLSSMAISQIRLFGRVVAKPYSALACFHTSMYTLEMAGLNCGIIAPTIGGPYAVLVAEQLHASGARLIVGLTSARRVSAQLSLPCLVVATSAIRDEGTSYHYLLPATHVTFSNDHETAATEAQGDQLISMYAELN